MLRGVNNGNIQGISCLVAQGLRLDRLHCLVHFRELLAGRGIPECFIRSTDQPLRQLCLKQVSQCAVLFLSASLGR